MESANVYANKILQVLVPSVVTSPRGVLGRGRGSVAVLPGSWVCSLPWDEGGRTLEGEVAGEGHREGTKVCHSRTGCSRACREKGCNHTLVGMPDQIQLT